MWTRNPLRGLRSLKIRRKKRVFSWHNTLFGPAIIVPVRGTTDTRFYEPTRLNADPTQTLVFTETAGHHNLVEVVVVSSSV